MPSGFWKKICREADRIQAAASSRPTQDIGKQFYIWLESMHF